MDSIEELQRWSEDLKVQLDAVQQRMEERLHADPMDVEGYLLLSEEWRKLSEDSSQVRRWLYVAQRNDRMTALLDDAEKLLGAAEPVLAAVPGSWGDRCDQALGRPYGSGVLLATEHRIVCCSRTSSGSSVETTDVYYQRTKFASLHSGVGYLTGDRFFTISGALKKSKRNQPWLHLRIDAAPEDWTPPARVGGLEAFLATVGARLRGAVNFEEFLDTPDSGAAARLKQVTQLHRDGLLTDEEFAAKRAELIDRL
ncbi:hypothetical protein DJ010_01000 [Nocardioides silvaticus]|uniref:SHOCT domain-containing protein n=1 Tax=Nocardioides silvaticus TaxID=2201891 RepID=A0A316TI45_9ACTN|nr:SHOCT domain-containing protein [Nocardioides silvaticus]PWN04263.1 hypothetical protein DJ010_01000 [Nocardioides silvaticus]